jgi:hypothetical protein
LDYCNTAGVSVNKRDISEYVNKFKNIWNDLESSSLTFRNR